MNPSDPPAHEKRGRGRPRDPAVDGAIIAAVHEVVGDVGVGATTMTEIARRAAIGKPTLYKRWRSVLPLVLRVLSGLQTPLDETTGSPRARIAAALADDRAFLVNGSHSRFLRAVLFAGASQPDLASALDACVLGPRKARLRSLAASAAPGLAGDDARLSAAVDLLCGPVIRGMLRASGQQREEPADAHLVDLVLDGIAMPGA